jgi:hypothetical protein
VRYVSVEAIELDNLPACAAPWCALFRKNRGVEEAGGDSGAGDKEVCDETEGDGDSDVDEEDEDDEEDEEGEEDEDDDLVVKEYDDADDDCALSYVDDDCSLSDVSSDDGSVEVERKPKWYTRAFHFVRKHVSCFSPKVQD